MRNKKESRAESGWTGRSKKVEGRFVYLQRPCAGSVATATSFAGGLCRRQCVKAPTTWKSRSFWGFISHPHTPPPIPLHFLGALHFPVRLQKSSTSVYVISHRNNSDIVL